MNFSEKLKQLRKQSGFSQEKLAEKLGVSRQAVTKWETNGGVPDIENLITIADFFHISLDELLSCKSPLQHGHAYLFESVTEYDIDRKKHYDIKTGWANGLTVTGYEGEKLKVTLASDTLHTVQNHFKVKIDDINERIDIDIKRLKDITADVAKRELFIFVQIPQQYLHAIEVNAYTTRLKVKSLICKGIEFDGKVNDFVIDGIKGNLSLNCNIDMNIFCNTFEGKIEINQLFSVSKMIVPAGMPLSIIKKGIGTRIYDERIASTAPNCKQAENKIEFNGIKSELTVYSSELQ